MDKQRLQELAGLQQLNEGKLPKKVLNHIAYELLATVENILRYPEHYGLTEKDVEGIDFNQISKEAAKLVLAGKVKY